MQGVLELNTLKTQSFAYRYRCGKKVELGNFSPGQEQWRRELCSAACTAQLETAWDSNQLNLTSVSFDYPGLPKRLHLPLSDPK